MLETFFQNSLSKNKKNFKNNKKKILIKKKKKNQDILFLFIGGDPVSQQVRVKRLPRCTDVPRWAGGRIDNSTVWREDQRWTDDGNEADGRAEKGPKPPRRTSLAAPLLRSLNI